MSGDRSVFAIESHLEQPLMSESQLGIGFFTIWLAGHQFGNTESDATLLGCSRGAIDSRLEQRGLHVFTDHDRWLGGQLAASYLATVYGVDADLSGDLPPWPRKTRVVWAPDGDAAFDDGSHVLHFDNGPNVRLLGFKNMGEREDIVRSVREVRMPSADFYDLLAAWRSAFDAERGRLLVLH